MNPVGYEHFFVVVSVRFNSFLLLAINLFRLMLLEVGHVISVFPELCPLQAYLIS